MSEPTPTEPLPTRWLKSPFNGEAWAVPPDLTPEMYRHMVRRRGLCAGRPAATEGREAAWPSLKRSTAVQNAMGAAKCSMPPGTCLTVATTGRPVRCVRAQELET